jgi:hypothetical protein
LDTAAILEKSSAPRFAKETIVENNMFINFMIIELEEGCGRSNLHNILQLKAH